MVANYPLCFFESDSFNHVVQGLTTVISMNWRIWVGDQVQGHMRSIDRGVPIKQQYSMSFPR